MLLHAYLLFWNLSTMGGVFLGLLLGGGTVSTVLTPGREEEGAEIMMNPASNVL
jgi:hypothetical protein